MGFRGEDLGLVFLGEESAEIVDGVFVLGHLAEVILPDVRAVGAAGEGLAGNLKDLTMAVDAVVGGAGDREADAGAGAPEGAGEVVGEEQGVIAALRGEQGERLLSARPDGADVGLKPEGKLKSIEL